MNLLTNFHEDRTINVVPRVKNAHPSFGSHVFQANAAIFEDQSSDQISSRLVINLASRVLTRKNAPPLGSHDFQANANLLTKFHEDWTINVASRVLTRKNAPHLGSHVFQANTSLLVIFHEDWTINVASRMLTRQMFTPHNGRPIKGDHKSSP
ncbi:hypothetical protein DPMN_165402 [Dreissena polymorpha]|uniref:Uncharacterized protein n=1 Tax=Dreissena polymorpha TaxID=45954 RepID=A0A9D4IT79_DREPO|nr:hypothetical protein DPMN_165402 [Dreissena polymorpha]